MTSTPVPAAPARPGHAEAALQKVCDASVWLLFRVSGVRS